MESTVHDQHPARDVARSFGREKAHDIGHPLGSPHPLQCNGVGGFTLCRCEADPLPPRDILEKPRLPFREDRPRADGCHQMDKGGGSVR